MKNGSYTPKQREGNQYRKYNKDDIRRLKLIYMFRKLDMPLGRDPADFRWKKRSAGGIGTTKGAAPAEAAKAGGSTFLLWGNTGNRTYRPECGSLSAENGSRRKTGK